MTFTPTPDLDAEIHLPSVLAIWPRIERMLRALNALELLACDASKTHAYLVERAAAGLLTLPDREVATAVCVLAAQDGMHASDWLRMKAVEATMPRRKPAPAIDLQLRLRGLNAKALSMRVLERDGKELARVTIRNAHGDVVSCEATEFAEALGSAMAMAGARQPQEGQKR